MTIDRVRLATLLSGLILLLMLVAGLHPGPRTWGLDTLGYLPRPLMFALLAAGFLLLLPPLRVRAGRALEPAARAFGDPKRERLFAVIVVAILLLAFWFGRTREFFLSDCRLLLLGAEDAARDYKADTMAVKIQWWAQELLARLGVTSQSASFRATSILSGVVWLTAILATIRLVTTDGRRRLFLAAILVTAGITKLFYGYPETSPLMAACVAFFLFAGVRAVTNGRGERLLALAAILPAAMHVTGLLVLPAFALILLPRWRSRPAARIPLIVAPLAILLLYAGAWLLRSAATEANPYASYFAEFLPLVGPLNAKQAYTLFAPAHFTDIANEMFLLGPWIVAGWLATLLLLRAAGRNFLASHPVEAFLLALLLPFLALSLVFHRLLGAARDWELVASVAPPSILLFALWFTRERKSGAWITESTALLASASLIHLAGWVAVDVDPDRSFRRFETLFADSAAVSPFASSYALEEIGQWYRQRGRMDEAIHAYERAVRADPGNAKAAGTLGVFYGAAGRIDEALALFRETIRLRPELGLAHFNLANALSRRNELPEAEAEYRESIRLEPEHAEAYLYLGAVLGRQEKVEEALATWRAGLKWAKPELAAKLRLALEKYGSAPIPPP